MKKNVMTSYEVMIRTHHQRMAREAYTNGVPVVRTGPGGDYVDDYTPQTRQHLTGRQRRYEHAIVWSIFCVALGGVAMAALVSILHMF